MKAEKELFENKKGLVRKYDTKNEIMNMQFVYFSTALITKSSLAK